MEKRKRLRIGDIIEIPLSNNRKSYAQYILRDLHVGPLIQVKNLILTEDFSLDKFRTAKPLFPPVSTGLFAAIRTGLWSIVGNLLVENFVYPGFISTFYDEKTGKARIWFLWDGTKDIRIGWNLPESYKKLEFLCVWSPYDVMERIETGEIPFPYKDLIQKNEFTPRNKE